MTETGIYYPDELTGIFLDNFLAKGWYRMGQGIFTTNHIVQNDKLYRVFWLRYNLSRLKTGRNCQKIMQINQKFSCTIKPLQITPELETLYELYKSSLTFTPASSVQNWLFDQQTNNVYDSYLVEVRDQCSLIAAGIFDNGLNSIAGIMNFFLPDYKKYSLGKYLMLLKIEYALTQGKKWYYPGYIVEGYPKFDYKLFVDKAAAEIFIPEHSGWCRYDEGFL